MIGHFHTSSLILGRSGTGKTTCLVVKMVRRYLASKAVMDGTPVRQVSKKIMVLALSAAYHGQVLLTRSHFLADKLRAYTRRSIETLSPELRDPESSQHVEQVFSMITEETFENEDASTLRDHSFPLVCTWDQFLRLLENTMIAFVRQNFPKSDGPLHYRSKGLKTAEAHLREEDGRRCNALNDIEGYIRNLGAAIDLFKKVELFGDAVRLLATLGRLQEAAELCFEQKLYARASPLFAEAGLYAKAAGCHQILEQHSEAASMLYQGSLFDQLVSYLDDYHGNLTPETLGSYNVLWKVLLKRNEISPEYRSRAIGILESSDDQEKFFLEYGMDEELAILYASRLRYKDFFRLHSRKGHLERALDIAITKDLMQPIADDLESEVLSLLDFVWMGHLQKNSQQQPAAPLKLPPGFLTPNVILRAEQWEASNLVYSLEGSVARQRVASMMSTVPKTILCLRKILGATAITKTVTLDDLPFEMMQEAVKFAKDLTLGKGSDTLKTMFLLAGLWKPTNSMGNLTVLPWSPLRAALTDVSSIDPTKAVTQKVLDHLVSAILAFDEKARDLWKEKWPIHCFRFVTIGFCSRKQTGEECHHVHQPISTDDCSRKLDDLLQINSVFCDLAVLYYRRCMNEKFQVNYLGIKRF